jgi:valyl-tRNA synthetase
MSDIPKTYEPQSVEAKWYEFWDQNGCFTADPARVSEQRPAYSIVIPPPNVTGVLTLGHVLNNTIQDILARKARMDGKEVLWLPGTDHAGIATQNVVEKTLKKEGAIKHRDDLGREALVAKIWEWKEKYGGIILKQLRALGASCDWTRTRFTMDEEYSKCVQKVFVDLYKKGLIYRGKRMVNWCPASLTALSDEEVIMKEQKGVLYYFRVQVVERDGTVVTGGAPGKAALAASAGNMESVKTPTIGAVETALPADAPAQFGPETDGDGNVWLTIATTRPETIPGDSAVAVNPKDPRYAPFIGKCVRRPLPVENQALLPIIGDEHIDIAFGTGVLKVTPAHDKADFEIGQRHQLEIIEVINADGTMNDLAGKDLAGLERFKARKVAAEKLTEIGATVKEEPYTNNVGFSERADVPVEPRLSEQWFLKYPSVEAARNCVVLAGSAGGPPADSADPAESSSPDLKLEHEVSGGPPDTARGPRALPAMRFHPDRWAKVYDHWMGGIQDWCISRQLWWGHQIPVWRLDFDSKLGGQNAERALNYLLVEQLERTDIALGTKGDLEFGARDGRAFISRIKKINAKTGKSSEQAVREALRWRPESGSLEVCVGPESHEVAKRLEADFGFTQDPDVLDTWFSSWLWPFATMHWTGDKAQDSTNPTLQAFYPTTDLVTGPDIIFFWVARMIMAGYEWMGDLPFRNVYFTGIIRDKQGRKMSKSLGNSPDPLDLIAKYGADALRFGVMRSAPLGQDVLFDEKNIELGRNFCTKLWNACRFRQMHGGESEGELDRVVLNTDDKWILLRLDTAIREVTQAFAEYRFTDATATLYRFFWNEYCDWYLETTKAVLMKGSAGGSPADSSGPEESSSSNLKPEHEVSGGPPDTAREPRALPTDYELRCRRSTLAVMDFVLGNTLRLFHPFLPFITEELWHGMGFNGDLPKGQGGDTIMFAHWPKPFDGEFRDHYGLDDCYLQFAENKYETVRRGRNLRSQFNIQSNRKADFILKPVEELIPHDIAVLKLLLNAETLTVDANYAPARGVPMIPTPLGELYLPLAGLIDVEAERARLTKELEKVQAEIEKVRAKLGNPSFTQKVPAEVLREHEERLVTWQQREQQIRNALEVLGG